MILIIQNTAGFICCPPIYIINCHSSEAANSANRNALTQQYPVARRVCFPASLIKIYISPTAVTMHISQNTSRKLPDHTRKKACTASTATLHAQNFTFLNSSLLIKNRYVMHAPHWASAVHILGISG